MVSQLPPAETDVRIQLPATPDQLPVLRTFAAAVAAEAACPSNVVEDVRLAADELGGLLIAVARPGASLSCRLRRRDDVITVLGSVAGFSGLDVDQRSFSWQVLRTLAGSASTWATAGPPPSTHIAASLPCPSAA